MSTTSIRSRFRNELRSLKNGNRWMNEIIFKFFASHSIFDCVICTDCYNKNVSMGAKKKIVLFYLKMMKEKRSGKKIKVLNFIKENYVYFCWNSNETIAFEKAKFMVLTNWRWFHFKCFQEKYMHAIDCCCPLPVSWFCLFVIFFLSHFTRLYHNVSSELHFAFIWFWFSKNNATPFIPANFDFFSFQTFLLNI